MDCRKCGTPLPDGARFCFQCGMRQEKKSGVKSRGNGQGSVYQLPNKTYIAIKTVGYTVDEQGKRHRKTVSKSGFKRRTDAVNYLSQLSERKAPKTAITFKALYDKWLPTHRAGADTLNCYKAAIKYFQPVWYVSMEDIDVDDLQECLDDCPRGKATRRNMRTLCGLLYKFGIPRKHIPDGLNLAEYLVVEGENGAGKTGLPEGSLEKIRTLIGKTPGADYVYAHCYLGFRPTEFLALDAKNYDRDTKAFVGGAKTDAGRDRTVTVSPKIQPIVDRLVRDKISGPVFCGEDGEALDIRDYRTMFYRVLEDAGIDNPTTTVADREVHTYTPHSCRHTFATLMKRVEGADKDKLELIGHTSPEMLRHYQDVALDDLKKITDAI